MLAMWRWGEIGDPLSGLRVRALYMRGVSRGGGRELTQPERTEVQGRANTPAMIPTALIVWLQGAPHPTMPNIVVRGQEIRGGFHVAAYIRV